MQSNRIAETETKTETERRQLAKQGTHKMTSRKEIATLAAMLAIRCPARGHDRIAADALKLARYGSAALTNATALCNVPNYQARYDKKRDSIRGHANALAAGYALRVELTGDPRGYCLRLFSNSAALPLAGNTWGGDESGFGV